MIFNNELKYDNLKVDTFDELPLEPLKILEWVGKDKTVLEIGCHLGGLSKWLKYSGNKVTGIDINNKALELAREFQEHSYCFNIENIQDWQVLENTKYDSVLLLHVLEHLSNPWEVLEIAKTYLKNEGVLIIGLPNICNAKTRLAIFKGNFIYEDIGVMDETHLRFFTYNTATQFINNANLKIEDYFSPWRINPFKAIVEHTTFIHKFKHLMPSHPPRFFSKNLTDVVMLFKCKHKL